MASNILINLSDFLKNTNILKFILPIIDEFVRYTFKTNEELKQAVDEWCEDKENAIKKYGHISIWNTKYITDMSMLFYRQIFFNDNISYWDTSNVVNMRSMFEKTSKFNIIDISDHKDSRTYKITL